MPRGPFIGGNNSTSQRQRNQFNPLNLGTFDQTSLRVLQGTLGMRSEIIQGGYGRDTYNHWYSIKLAKKGYLLLFKAGTKLATSNLVAADVGNQYVNDRFMVAAYDQNRNPLFPLPILQQPEIYFGQVAPVQGPTMNTVVPYRFEEGNELYYELQPGRYLICVSATCNELSDFGVGLAIEFPTPSEQFILLEDTEIAYLLQESLLNTPGGETFTEILSPLQANVTIDTISALTRPPAIINPGIFCQVNNTNSNGVPLTWVIKDFAADPDDEANDRVLLDATENWYLSVPRTHSRTEWREAWRRDHSQDNRYPAIVFDKYTNTE